MIKALLTILIVPLFFLVSHAQKVEVIRVPDLERMIHNKEDNIVLINFWATWCKPCVTEMPHFEALSEHPDYSDVIVKLISIDFVENLESKVERFIRKRNIRSEVFLIDNVDYNFWIDKVDETWTGTIPATLIVHGKSGKRKFYEKEFKGEELEMAIDDFKASL